MQINTMQTGDSEGPAWNKFWLSLDNETESMVSGEGSQLPRTELSRSHVVSPGLERHHSHMDHHQMDRGESVMPNDSASHVGMETPEHSAVAASPGLPLEEMPFAFKFKAPSGRTHRFHATPAAGLGDFIVLVSDKLSTEVEAVGGLPTFEEGRLSNSGFALSYLDNEGDSVSITTNRDLLEAVSLAHMHHSDKVDLFVHDPAHPPLPGTMAPQGAPAVSTPPDMATVRGRKFVPEEEESDEEVEKPRRKKQQPAAPEQVIQGVPNELLLPGAIVTLAVVIVGVFALGRATSR